MTNDEAPMTNDNRFGMAYTAIAQDAGITTTKQQ
jgi:hypothetical protein